MSNSLARPLFRFNSAIARSPCLNKNQYHSLSGICWPPSAIRTRTHLPQTWFMNRLSVSRRGQHLWTGLLATTGITLGVTMCTGPTIHCDNEDTQNSAPITPPQGSLAPPKSAVNLYELSFGTIAGICAGVFTKKGAKMVAFFLGGVFVLLQYLNSMSFVRVDWGRIASRFENLLYTKDASGNRRAPTILSLWRWAVDFLTADFQPRASFIAGFALGLRVG